MRSMVNNNDDDDDDDGGGDDDDDDDDNVDVDKTTWAMVSTSQEI